MKRIKLFNSLLIISAIIFALSGCTKDKEDGSPIPPIESMEMNFSFTKTKSMPLVNDTSHFIIAKVAVTYWALAAAVHTALPVYAFKTAVSNKPMYDNVSNTYTWSFNFKFANDNYTASLSGKVNLDEDSVAWRMDITKVGSTGPAFKWYEGKSAMDRSGGWWILYNPSLATEDKKALKVDWANENGVDGFLRYTDIIIGDANNGAYIEFGSDSSLDLDKYFEIYIKNDEVHPANNGKTYSIEWSSINKNGYISDGTNKYCWGTNYVNTTCD